MNELDKFMSPLTSNKYIKGAVTVFLVFYGGFAAASLPPFLRQLFKNDIFKVFILALTAVIISKDLQIGVVVATAFMLTLVGLNAMDNKEKFNQVEQLLLFESFNTEED
jgi:hypothetical protein